MTEPEQPSAGAQETAAAAPAPEGPQPADPQPGAIPGQPLYGTGAQPGYPPPYPQPAGYPPQYQYPYGYGYPQQPSGTNGLAIAAMICGICGFLCVLPGVVGIILGIVSLPQIKRSQQSGRGMAIAGIVMGALWIVGFVLLIVLGHHGQLGNSGSDGSGPGNPA